MTRLDLFMRAGGAIDANTWSMMDDSTRDLAAQFGDDLREELARLIASEIVNAIPEAMGLDTDALAQQVTELMAQEVPT